MAIPLSSTNFSLQYSGSFSKMDVKKLNSFIEAGEHQRIKSGTLQSATFNINVNSGHASGKLRLAYNDLTVAVLNEETGSEKGFFNRILSLFGKVFIIRGTNMLDKNGSMKIGEISHTKKPGEHFFHFIWFALKSGVGDVVGFPSDVNSDN